MQPSTLCVFPHGGALFPPTLGSHLKGKLSLWGDGKAVWGFPTPRKICKAVVLGIVCVFTNRNKWLVRYASDTKYNQNFKEILLLLSRIGNSDVLNPTIR